MGEISILTELPFYPFKEDKCEVQSQHQKKNKKKQHRNAIRGCARLGDSLFTPYNE